jgi:hypothetical protein
MIPHPLPLPGYQLEPTCGNAFSLVDTTIRTEDSPVRVVDDHAGFSNCLPQGRSCRVIRMPIRKAKGQLCGAYMLSYFFR